MMLFNIYWNNKSSWVIIHDSTITLTGTVERESNLDWDSYSDGIRTWCPDDYTDSITDINRTGRLHVWSSSLSADVFAKGFAMNVGFTLLVENLFIFVIVSTFILLLCCLRSLSIISFILKHNEFHTLMAKVSVSGQKINLSRKLSSIDNKWHFLELRNFLKVRFSKMISIR